MIKRTMIILAVFIAAPPVYAAGVDAAGITKAIDAASGDAAKVNAYCNMSKKLDEIGNDDKKAEAAGDEIDGYFKVLGAEFSAAWEAGQTADEKSAEGKAFDDAMGKLDAKCTP